MGRHTEPLEPAPGTAGAEVVGKPCWVTGQNRLSRLRSSHELLSTPCRFLDLQLLLVSTAHRQLGRRLWVSNLTGIHGTWQYGIEKGSPTLLFILHSAWRRAFHEFIVIIDQGVPLTPHPRPLSREGPERVEDVHSGVAIAVEISPVAGGMEESTFPCRHSRDPTSS